MNCFRAREGQGAADILSQRGHKSCPSSAEYFRTEESTVGKQCKENCFCLFNGAGWLCAHKDSSLVNDWWPLALMEMCAT